VALLRPSSSTALAKEAVNRIQGELTAEGFEVVIVDSPVAWEPGSSPVEAADAIATIELVVDAQQHVAELRVIDRLTNKSVTRRTAIAALADSQLAEVLAVRAVELLRASLVELLIQSHPPPAETVPRAAQVAGQRVASTWAENALEMGRRSNWGFEAGSALLLGFGNVGPALLGVVRVRFALNRSIQLRATAAGLGTQPQVTGRVGSANVSQQLDLIELVAVAWPDRFVHPFASIGAGALYTAVDGHAVWPYGGHQGTGWSAAVDAGLGAELRLSQRFDLAVEAHAFVTSPEQVVRFLGQDVARIGEPSLLGTLTVAGWL
jgi:hypothetical protein